MEFISLNPTEQKRSPYIRPLILKRDKHTTFPLVIDGRLEGMNYFGPAHTGAVHHISPFSFLKRHQIGVDPNHPLNLVTIDHNSHNMIHQAWVHRYGCNPEVIKHEVYYGGKAGWEDIYDEVLTGIAIIRSYEYMQEDPTWFVPYQEEVASHYEMLDPDFLDRYNRFRI